jgi:hypothetical protein
LALAGAQVVERLARELAVAGEAAHGVVHVTIARLVGQPLFLQQADHRQHLRHVLGGARLVGRTFDAERADVRVHGRSHLVGELANRDTTLDGAADDLVVDVRDVAHIGDLPATGAQPALHDIEGHHHAGVADVAEVVDGHAAHVHAHMAGVDGLEVFERAREAVVDTQGHRSGRLGRGSSGYGGAV